MVQTRHCISPWNKIPLSSLTLRPFTPGVPWFSSSNFSTSTSNFYTQPQIPIGNDVTRSSTAEISNLPLSEEKPSPSLGIDFNHPHQIILNGKTYQLVNEPESPKDDLSSGRISTKHQLPPEFVPGNHCRQPPSDLRWILIQHQSLPPEFVPRNHHRSPSSNPVILNQEPQRISAVGQSSLTPRISNTTNNSNNNYINGPPKLLRRRTLPRYTENNRLNRSGRPEVDLVCSECQIRRGLTTTRWPITEIIWCWICAKYTTSARE